MCNFLSSSLLQECSIFLSRAISESVSPSAYPTGHFTVHRIASFTFYIQKHTAKWAESLPVYTSLHHLKKIRNKTHWLSKFHSVIKLYMLRASSVPIIRSSVPYIWHW